MLNNGDRTDEAFWMRDEMLAAVLRMAKECGSEFSSCVIRSKTNPSFINITDQYLQLLTKNSLTEVPGRSAEGRTSKSG